MRTVLTAIAAVLVMYACNSSNQQPKSPEEIKIDLKQAEQNRGPELIQMNLTCIPNIIVTQKETLFKNEKKEQVGWKVSGTLKSAATLATFKDYQIKVKFFTQSGTLITESYFVLDNVIAPGATININNLVDGPPADHGEFAKVEFGYSLKNV